MGAIFISYRRDDTEGQAGRLFEELSRQFGPAAVFMDVAAIEPGRDFRRAIDQQVASCGVLLALVGKHWLDAVDEQVARRLDDPLDFVRLETAAALRRDIPVVPVLVHGAAMPRAEQLPEELKAFAFRNAVALSHARWASDVQLLVQALRPHVPALPAPPDRVDPVAPWRSRAGAAAAAVILVGAGLAWWQWGGDSDRPAGPPLNPISLVGNWPTADCTLKIDQDDGKEIRGLCDTGIEHRFAGRYTANDTVNLTVTRLDRSQACTLTVAGKLVILGPDAIEFSQAGWKGCGVNTERVVMVLKRG